MNEEEAIEEAYKLLKEAEKLRSKVYLERRAHVKAEKERIKKATEPARQIYKAACAVYQDILKSYDEELWASAVYLDKRLLEQDTLYSKRQNELYKLLDRRDRRKRN